MQIANFIALFSFQKLYIHQNRSFEVKKNKLFLGFSFMTLLSLSLACQGQIEKEEVPKKENALFSEGSTDVFSFVTNGPLSSTPIDVYFHIPKGDIKNMPILMSFHGAGRNADDYRDCWINIANEKGFIVFSPEFNTEQFPSSDNYQTGNVFIDADKPSPESMRPQNEWTFSIIDSLFTFVSKEIGTNQKTFKAWGHSAGSQFLHRYLFYVPESAIEVAVCSNAGWYTVPEFGVRFPYGFQDSQIKLPQLEKAFAKKVFIHLGEADTDPNATNLRRNELVDAQQGNNRRARGRYFFETAQKTASQNAFYFNWSKTSEVPGVEHEYAKMAADAAKYLFE